MRLNSNRSDVSCYVTVEPEDHIYKLQTFDTTDRTFHSGNELLAWVKKNWEPVQFQNPSEYQQLLHAVAEELKNGND
ncbi:hypothetical protein LQ50_09240 [Halalkalibacter okhensis]|uniref:Threonine dehydratase n=2 Tax=Halalkalibacter okhensis TaxID=333138 RepID=A0A0B0ID10_9BACI|nr:hypothetical protein [Halalkalibacter okhensis]KHF40448.1 hypothetical protein LQ50_09240 [Halalkalibacter okhensis]